MLDKFEQLESKIGQLVERYTALKEHFDSVSRENENLKTELSSLKQEFEAFRLLNNDRSELVKTRLGSVLGRIEELESLGL